MGRKALDKERKPLNKKQKEWLVNVLPFFYENGIKKPTMDDIANAIGMTKASLYYYYKNKENIICDTIESEVYNFFQKASEKLLKIKTATNKLSTLVKFETEYFQEKVGTFDLSVNTIMEAQPLILIYGLE